MRRAAWLLVLVLAGCGGDKPDKPDVVDTRPEAAPAHEQVEDLLARDARRIARRQRRLGLRRVAYVIDSEEFEGDRGRLRVRLLYGVAGVQGRFTSTRTVRASRKGTAWRLAGITGRRQRPPWEVGRYRRIRSPHFVIFAPADVDVVAGGLPETLEDARVRMREVLTRGSLEPRYLVVVAGDVRQARSLTSSIRGLSSLTAITDSEVRQAGVAQRVTSVASQRLLVMWPSFQTLDPESRRIVVAHELTHAVVAPVTSGRTPGWLAEGLALYVSGDRRVDQAAGLVTEAVASGGPTRRALTLTGLSHPDSVGRLGGDAQAAAYAYSSAAAFYIRDRFGHRKLLSLYDAFNKNALAGEPGDVVMVDEAVRRTLGIGLAKLERDLRRWIVTRAVVDPFSP